MNVNNIHPLSWPNDYPRTPKSKRRRSPFSGTEGKTLNFLKNELRLLGAKNVRISCNVEFRIDGFPYANQKQPDDVGIAIYFDYNGKPISMSVDKWDKVFCNFKALAKTIESMRGLERWGASDMLERIFHGFAQLPYYSDVITVGMSWRDVLGFDSTELLDLNEEMIRSKHRKLAKEAHPDKPGGSNEQMSELNAARDMALREVS